MGKRSFSLPQLGRRRRFRPLTPAEFRQRAASLAPQPYPGDRAALALQIEKELGAKRGKIRVAWLADGMDDAGAEALSKVLSGLAADGVVDIYGDAPGAGALALTQPPSIGAGPIRARVLKAEPGASSRADRRRNRARREAGGRALRHR